MNKRRTYRVKVVFTHEVYVAATSKDKAIEQACEIAWQYDPDETATEILGVEDIKNDD